jgi:hypothetical protein
MHFERGPGHLHDSFGSPVILASCPAGRLASAHSSCSHAFMPAAFQLSPAATAAASCVMTLIAAASQLLAMFMPGCCQLVLRQLHASFLPVSRPLVSCVMPASARHQLGCPPSICPSSHYHDCNCCCVGWRRSDCSVASILFQSIHSSSPIQPTTQLLRAHHVFINRVQKALRTRRLRLEAWLCFIAAAVHAFGYASLSASATHSSPALRSLAMCMQGQDFMESILQELPAMP